MTQAWKPALTVAAAVGALWCAAPAVQAQDVLMDYGVDVVSDYVFRGIDVHRSVYVSREEEETPFNVAPAVQPTIGFYSPSGIWFNFWGSFAVTDRDSEDSPNPNTGDTFDGLKTADEIDTTIGYDWSNVLGGFSIGIVNYALINTDVQGGEDATIQEMFFSWSLPFAESIAPSFSYYLDSNTAVYYAALGFGGGDTLEWGANIGYGSAGSQGIQDITGSLAYGIGGGASISLNAAYRPTPQLVGYNSDGEYASQEDGSVADYPPAIAWVGIGWGGEVTE